LVLKNAYLLGILKIIIVKFAIILILPLIFLTYGIQNIPEVDAVNACSLTHMNEFIMKSASPRECMRVNYWVHYECGRVPGMYLTDERCQPPTGFPLQRLATSGSFMEISLDKPIYKLGDTILVSGNAYTSVGLPEKNLGIKVVDSTGKTIFEGRNTVDKLGKFGFNILTGPSIGITQEGNHELVIVHYGKYGSTGVQKFTVSHDGLPIVIAPPPDPVQPAPVQPAPVQPAPVVTTQDPEPFTTNWMTIAALLVVGAAVAYFVFKKVTGSGLSVPSTNYSHFREEQYGDSENKEKSHDNSKKSKDPMYPTYEDLKNNFKRYSWEDAEDLTALLFKAKSYSAEVGVPTKDQWKRKRIGDHGIDVRAKIDNVTVGIQVKHWSTSNVTEDDVIKTNGSSQLYDRLIIISTMKGFEKNAISWAAQPGNAEKLDLWDSKKFKEEIKKYLIEKDNSQFEEPKSQLKPNPNYYEILGASRDDTQEEIKRKYKELALKFHPDKAKSALSGENMKKITEAKDVLCDPDKRKQYDSELDSI
jgi:hypothetical protein